MQAFGNNDQTTLDYLSKRAGECALRQTNHIVSEATSTSTNDPSMQSQFQGLAGGKGEAGIVTGPLGLLADHSTSGTSASTTESWSTQTVRAPLILPDELNRLLSREENNQLVLISGKYPFLMQRST